MERVGIYGGTFNPPHVGHIRAAAYAISALELDMLLMIPTRIAPHKTLPTDSATPEQRLVMLRLATQGMEKLLVSDLELMREGPSFTYLTVAQLRQQYPEARFYLLMGSDMYLSFPSWRCPEEILQDASLAVLCRGDEREREKISEQLAAVPATLLENPVTEISSTQLRRLLAFGCAGAYLPSQVEAYIQEQGLYATGGALEKLPTDKLEAAVRELVDPHRVSHVLGCRDTAVALANRWGAEPAVLARAALLHDITKALGPALELTLARAYGMVIDKRRFPNPITLHAYTGSEVARRVFGESDSVVQAIACHTTGKPDMNLTEKILYLADMTEPTRSFPGVQELRRLAWEDLDRAMCLGLERTVASVRQRGLPVAPDSLAALEDIQTRMVNG